LSFLPMQPIPAWAWLTFGALVLVLLTVDLAVHRGEHAQSRKAAVVWSIVWVAAGLAFNGFVWVAFGGHAAEEYLAAYLIEKSLSLDNIFVFFVIFQSLNIPTQFQHHVLFWGIFGALVFRALFIFLGVAAMERYAWVSWLFGAVLILTAVRVFREDPAGRKENRVVKWLSRHLPVTHVVDQKRLVVVRDGKRVATPLLIALMGLELTDIVFAIDSVPAAFAVTHERFILYSSNAFAILGLRALYTVLAHSIQGLKYLHYGLAVVLGFAGVKILVDRWVHIPALASVGFIVLVVGIAVWASVRARAPLSPWGRDKVRGP
ncbi:MAG: TerC/Alx family metal homeostasis membrane protein, partial [Myxococcaceae bacterium]|nr:TerC/Alx family metal homeostasis membrane protein [Myxococcaceae bacterium]